MKKSMLRSIVTAVGFLLLVGWCYIMVSPSDVPPPEQTTTDGDVPTSTFTPRLEPQLIGFDSICNAQDEIRVEGFLHVPDRVSCVSADEEETCTIQLTDLITRNQLLVALPVDGEPDSPVSNHMVSLPIPYDTTDLMLYTDDAEWVGEGSIVSLTGYVESHPTSGCRLVDISRVEKLAKFSLDDQRVRQATLRAALKEGWVEISITGNGLNRIDLKIEPQVDFNLNLEIEAGTIFLSDAASVQNMVVRKQSFVYVTSELEADVELEVSCANMTKKQPGKQNTFTVMPDLAPQDLIDLMNLAEFAFEPMRIQQFSVWTVTDNPARDSYVGITASFAAEGSGPTDDELARIKELFMLAGIDVARYGALQGQ